MVRVIGANELSQVDVPEAPTSPDPESTLRSRAFVAVLLLACVVGVIASLAAWCFLELIFYIQRGVFTDIPKDLGFRVGEAWPTRAG